MLLVEYKEVKNQNQKKINIIIIEINFLKVIQLILFFSINFAIIIIYHFVTTTRFFFAFYILKKQFTSNKNIILYHTISKQFLFMNFFHFQTFLLQYYTIEKNFSTINPFTVNIKY